MARSKNISQRRRPASKRILLAASAVPLGAMALGIAALGLVLLGVLGIQVWDSTNSSAFCIDACHDVHPEEALAYQDSYHARVTCTECHIGRVGTLQEIARKTTHASHLTSVILDQYDRPLVSKSMRPANETCELCHWSPASHDDTVRDIQSFLPDWDNTAKRTRLVLKTGAGAGDHGTGYGIHWHTTNLVEYIATDDQKQDIRWVRTTLPDGRTVEYNDALQPLAPEEIARAEKRVMDCVDCHNQVGHPFPSPEGLVDKAMAVGRLSPDLPFAKKEVLALVAAGYASQEEALGAAGSLANKYQTTYPKVYLTQRTAVDQAVSVTKELMTRLVFEEPGVTWRSFANNGGHQEFVGCFRCHDGDHVSQDGKAISLTCTTCHSVPVTVYGSDPLPDATLVPLDKPDSHLAPTFMADHRVLANPTCGSCHGDIRFGRDDASFCANSACHAGESSAQDLDLASQHILPLGGGHAEVPCYSCHDGESRDGSECTTCHEPPLETHFGSVCEDCHTVQGFEMASLGGFEHQASLEGRHALLDCTTCHQDRPDLAGECAGCHVAGHDPVPGNCADCHTTANWEASLDPAGQDASPVPHTVSSGEDCLACHSPAGSERPAPAGHSGFGNEQCLSCHTVADAARPAPSHPDITFPLTERHATLQCSQCHADGLQSTISPECVACHNDYDHQGRFGQDCAQCHSPAGWLQTSFEHATTAFALRGSHQAVACEDCHGPAPGGKVSKVCYSCHQEDDVHAAEFGEQCGQCHNAGAWAQASFDHDTTGWQLAGSHAQVACQDCHAAGSSGSLQRACSACHQDTRVHDGEFGQDCAVCHTPKNWQAASFDHTRSGNPLTGAHTQTPCLDCHSEGRRSSGLQLCQSCHLSSDVHGGRFGQSCDQCHTPDGWQGASFDHGLAAFVLSGAHLEVACQDCHTNDVYSGTPQNCGACHGEPAVHAGQFGTACATCHTTATWTGARFEQSHTFPRDHRGNDANNCQTCHPDDYQAYTCFTCHEHRPDKIEEEHRDEGVEFGANCVDCHPAGRKPDDDDDD